MSTYVATNILETIACSECAGVYAISTEFMNEARRLGGFKKCWKCPYCQSERGFGEGKVQELEKQIGRLQETVEYQRKQREYAEQESAHFRKSRDGMKGVLFKERKRVRNGVCPCCNRTFKNLHNHMTTKHPKFST